jgi:O-antigen/teichoic acid export membrane protein
MLVAAGALVAIGHWLVLLWTRGSISAGHSLLLTFGLWAVVTSIGGPLAAFLNGAKVMGFQIIVSFVSAAGNIALSIFLARRIGAPGVVLGSIISQVVLNFIPYSFFLPRLFTTIEKRAIAAKRDRVAF